MTSGRPGSRVASDASRLAPDQKRWPDGCVCYRATLDDLLSDDMIAPVLRNAGYEADEFRRMDDRNGQSRRNKMFVRLKLEDTRDGLVATISQRGDDGKITERPSIFLVAGKQEAKQKAKAVARALGLKTYGVVDKTSSRIPPPIRSA
jgi:hypothetical protein